MASLSIAGKPAPDFVKRELPQFANPKAGCFKVEINISLGAQDRLEGRKRDLRQAQLIDVQFERAEELLAAGRRPVSAEQSPSDSAPIDLEQLEALALNQLLGHNDSGREHGDDRRRLRSPEKRRQWPDLIALVHGPDGRRMEIDTLRPMAIISKAKGKAPERLWRDAILQ